MLESLIVRQNPAYARHQTELSFVPLARQKLVHMSENYDIYIYTCVYIYIVEIACRKEYDNDFWGGREQRRQNERLNVEENQEGQLPNVRHTVC